MMLAPARRAATDQIRTQATSPMALLAALALPFVIAVILHSYGGGATSTGLAVGIAGIGILDTIIVLVVVGILSEKQTRTLYAALSSPDGLVPLIIGRLAGMTVQALLAIPGSLLFLGLLWGLAPGFSWGTWLVGALALAISTMSVVGLLAFVVLRFPFSPGMANGILGIVMSLSALLVPASAFPPAVRAVAWIVPQSHVMAWVRGGGASQLLIAAGLSAVSYGVVLASIRRVERAARRYALPLEA